MDYYANNDWRNHLSHYGIHGQKWHRRRFQNLDDSLTPEGRKRYPPLPDYVRYARIAEENRKRNPYKKLLKNFEQKEIDDFQTKEIKKLFKKDGFEFTGDMGELREYLKTHSAATYKEILKEFEPKEEEKPEAETDSKEQTEGERNKQLKHQLIEGSLDLYHHGIEGQKWGVQNGPPHPLDRETHNRVVAGDRTAGSALVNRNDQIKEEQYSSANNPDYVQKLTSPIEGTDYWKTNFSWRNDAGAGGRGLSATAALREEAARKGFYFEKNFWYSSDSIGYLRDNISKVNKGFGEVDGCTNNCTKCTFVCELYKRGFKGYQAGRLEYGARSDALAYWFKDATFEHGALDEIDSKINSYGDRSSGALDLRLRGDTGGHSIHYIRENGKFSINEGQSGKTYEASTFKEALGKYIESHSWFDIENQPIGITRLDNCDVDWDHAIEDSCIRGDSVYNRYYNWSQSYY